jgi:hypothetical protein
VNEFLFDFAQIHHLLFLSQRRNQACWPQSLLWPRKFPGPYPVLEFDYQAVLLPEKKMQKLDKVGLREEKHSLVYCSLIFSTANSSGNIGKNSIIQHVGFMEKVEFFNIVQYLEVEWNKMKHYPREDL